MQVGTEKMLLFFYLAALYIQLRLRFKLGFFASPCISTSRTNYSFCLHLPFQCACAGVTKYSLANSSPCCVRGLKSALPAVVLAL